MKLQSNDGEGLFDGPGTSAFGIFLRKFIDRDVAIVLGVALITRLLFMLLMPGTLHSVDAISWERVAGLLDEEKNPYQATTLLNWPPFWMQCIFLLSKMAHTYSIPFFRMLQLFVVAVESGVIVLVIKLIRTVTPEAKVRSIVIAGIALNPAPLFLTCMHCNFDIIVGFWVLLFVLFLVRYQQSGEISDWLCACLFLGLGILTKTVPLILIPMLAGGFRRAGLSLQVIATALVLGPVTLGMSIIYSLTPVDVAEKVLAYRSIPGSFGITGLLNMAGLQGMYGFYNAIFYAALLVALVFTTIYFWGMRSIGSRETVLYAALLLACVPTLGPGFGTQYLYWYLPLLVATYPYFDDRWQLALRVFGIAIAIIYTVQCAVIGAEGAFVVNIWMSKGIPIDVLGFFASFENPGVQTLVYLPMFLSCLYIIALGIHRLIRYTRISLSERMPESPKI